MRLDATDELKDELDLLLNRPTDRLNQWIEENHPESLYEEAIPVIARYIRSSGLDLQVVLTDIEEAVAELE